MAQKTYDMAATNSREIRQSPLTILPGAEPRFAITISGSGTIASPTMKLYKGSKDISSTNLTGSMVVAGRTITCKQITGLSKGEYVFYVYYTDGGLADGVFCRFSVPREGA